MDGKKKKEGLLERAAQTFDIPGETIGLPRVELVGQHEVRMSNHRGILVLERCGFVKEGTIREGFLWPDKGIVDLSLYSLLPTDLRREASGIVF